MFGLLHTIDTPPAPTRAHSVETRRAVPRRGAASFAIVPDMSAGAYYLLEHDNNTWQGPYASRMDAELALVACLSA